MLTDLTVDTNPADVATGANVEQVVGASRDASYVYFVATGNLASGADLGRAEPLRRARRPDHLRRRRPERRTRNGPSLLRHPRRSPRRLHQHRSPERLRQRRLQRGLRVHLRRRAPVRLLSPQRRTADRRRLDRGSGALRRRQPPLLPERRRGPARSPERAAQRLRVRGWRSPSADPGRRLRRGAARRQRLGPGRLHRQLRRTLPAGPGPGLLHLRRARKRRGAAAVDGNGVPG